MPRLCPPQRGFSSVCCLRAAMSPCPQRGSCAGRSRCAAVRTSALCWSPVVRTRPRIFVCTTRLSHQRLASATPQHGPGSGRVRMPPLILTLVLVFFFFSLVCLLVSRVSPPALSFIPRTTVLANPIYWLLVLPKGLLWVPGRLLARPPACVPPLPLPLLDPPTLRR